MDDTHPISRALEEGTVVVELTTRFNDTHGTSKTEHHKPIKSRFTNKRLQPIEIDQKVTKQPFILWHPFSAEKDGRDVLFRVWLHWEWPMGVLADITYLARLGAQRDGYCVHGADCIEVVAAPVPKKESEDRMFDFAVPFDKNNSFFSKKIANKLRYNSEDPNKFTNKAQQQQTALEEGESLTISTIVKEDPEEENLPIPIALHTISPSNDDCIVPVTLYRAVTDSISFGDFLTKGNLGVHLSLKSEKDLEERVLVQGIKIDANVLLADLYRLLKHLDLLLHICVLRECK